MSILNISEIKLGLVIWLNGISPFMGYLMPNHYYVYGLKVNIFVYQGIARIREKGLLIFLYKHMLCK